MPNALKGICLLKNKIPQNKPTLKGALGRVNLRLVATLSALIIVFLAGFKLLKNLDLYLLAVILYSTVTLVTALWYIIYNKGMVSGGVTPAMLPSEWSDERKRAFIEDLSARRKRSRPALLILTPMVVVFGLECLELYVFPPLAALLSSLALFET